MHVHLHTHAKTNTPVHTIHMLPPQLPSTSHTSQILLCWNPVVYFTRPSSLYHPGVSFTEQRIRRITMWIIHLLFLHSSSPLLLHLWICTSDTCIFITFKHILIYSLTVAHIYTIYCAHIMPPHHHMLFGCCSNNPTSPVSLACTFMAIIPAATLPKKNGSRLL